jgi:hypothetical protein
VPHFSFVVFHGRAKHEAEPQNKKMVDSKNYFLMKNKNDKSEEWKVCAF